MLTKSKYLSGLQCGKRLWIEEYAPELLGSASSTQSQLFVQGSEVGRLARTRFPLGKLIVAAGHAAVAATRAAMAMGEPCIFEAAFVHENVFVRCDVLVREPNNSWTLIEVKSTTQVKAHHLHDLAVQQWVLAGEGIEVGRVQVMHLNNRTVVYPDLKSLFITVDMTRTVARLLDRVSKHVKTLKRKLAQPAMPAVDIGTHCFSPFPCPVRSHCWKDVPQHSIFTIPRLSPRKLTALLKLGILRVQDIPPEYPLSVTQRAYVARVVSGKAVIAYRRIAKRLALLEYPLYFLDFETHAYAIPRFEGMRPYQQLPFQYSLHVLEADGTLRHVEYLHMTHEDPREALAQKLAHDIGNVGSVVVYNARFERGVLLELARRLPNERSALLSVVARLWDQLDVFRYDYLDPAFEGSNSIKRVLPVLAPHLSYDDLAVKRGDQAQSVWQALIHATDPAVQEVLAQSLRAYCQLDTLAMKEIHEALVRLVDPAGQIE
jgi:predicted RecB family nuclease